MNVAEASEILCFAEKVETIQLQSFIDMRWAEYMNGNPGDGLLPLAVKRAHWTREYYYPLRRKFFVSLYEDIVSYIDFNNLHSFR